LSDLYNTWVLVGSDDWKTSWTTIQGTLAPTSLAQGQSIVINGVSVQVQNTPNNTVANLADDINTAGITGVYAATIGGKLSIYATSEATSDGSTGGEGAVSISNAPLSSLMSALGIVAKTYYAPAYQASPSYQTPRWGATQPLPEPTGSIWVKTNNVNLGTDLIVKKYNQILK
jgi:hypothetical protein